MKRRQQMDHPLWAARMEENERCEVQGGTGERGTGAVNVLLAVDGMMAEHWKRAHKIIDSHVRVTLLSWFYTRWCGRGEDGGLRAGRQWVK